MSIRAQGSDASRPSRPASSCLDSSAHHGDDTLPSSAKSSKASALEDLLRPAIVIKPHPPKLTVKPRSLQPLMLLPRECLRLSYLDLTSPYGSFEPSVSFEANIRILNLESRMGNRPVVLIARLESNKSVYAIERQADKLYTLCHLGAWVDLEQLCDIAVVSCSALLREQPSLPVKPTTSLPLTTPQISHTNKKRRIAIEAIQSLVKKPRSQSISTLSQTGEGSRPATPSQGVDVLDRESAVGAQATPSVAISSSPPGAGPHIITEQNQDEALAPNAEGIFDNIRHHYFEALYHSMGSLAYFAKGPLSRARATFHLDCDSTLEMTDLVEFLKTLVMTTAQIDKKYRDTIPKIQSEMKNMIEDSDVDQPQGKGKPRKRKPKMKLGKDGLYPNEEDHVRRWWTVHKPLPKDDEESTTISTEQQDIKLQISLLRSRETQLQMIILLEILSLEPLVVSETANNTQLPGLPAVGDSPKPRTPLKKRHKHNFPTLLDVHADRLSIWQSTAFDSFSVANESQMGSRPQSRKSSKPTSDPLQDFCVDIIVPFFSAKLPERCDAINRKLGGPVMMPSPKSARKNPETTPKIKSRPGTAAKRPAQPHRTLETFLSKETERNRRSISRGPSGVIALMRSASTPTVPLFKREASEPRSLTGIPKADTSTAREARPTSSTTALVPSERKVESKDKKDAFVEAELRDAISTLRRPNREVVGKAMAEADERRAVTSLSQLRKSRKPIQHNRSPAIVKATPVGSRFHNALAKEHESQSISFPRLNIIAEDEGLPSSSMVPSSAPRKRNREAAFGRDPLTQPRPNASAADQIIATPAKQSTQNRHFLSVPRVDEGLVLASSPITSQKIPQPNFAVKKRPVALGHRDSGIEMPLSPGGPKILAETPIKPRQNHTTGSMDHYVTVTPIKKGARDNSNAISGSGPKIDDARGAINKTSKKEMSIYERLGWDDDYDDLA